MPICFKIKLYEDWAWNLNYRRLSFLCRLPDIKIAWINPFPNSNQNGNFPKWEFFQRSAFVDFIKIFIRYRSKHNAHQSYQWWPMRWFQLQFFSCFFLLAEQISINFVYVCLMPTLCILFKLDTGFFSCCSLTHLVNMG